MGDKAGFNEDALFDIASVTFDDAGATPAAPPAQQLTTYAENGKIRKKDPSNDVRTVGPQDADEVLVDIGSGDNILVGATIQDILNKLYGPTNSELPAYLGNGELDYVEFFRSATQTTGNRIAKVAFTYDGSLNPTSEVIQLFDADGTTVLKTVTLTHTFVTSEYTKTTQVVS